MDSFKKVGLIEEAEVESETTHWQLNSDSSIAENLGSCSTKISEVRLWSEGI